MTLIDAITPAVNTGPVGKDDPRAAYRTDRLLVAELGRMSEGDLLDVVNRWGGEDGAWAAWLTEQAVARLEREYGYGREEDGDEEAERWDGMA